MRLTVMCYKRETKCDTNALKVVQIDVHVVFRQVIIRVQIMTIVLQTNRSSSLHQYQCKLFEYILKRYAED